MNLIIVESPNKISKIKSFLPANYEVIASVGHIKELSHTGFNQSGVNDDGTLNKQVSDSKIQAVTNIQIQTQRADCEKIYIATDLDREGEGIAADIVSVLKPAAQAKVIRIGFKAITKNDVLQALQNPIGTIDQNLVAAQNARQGIDKIAGFTLSKFTQKQQAGKSAGRCQSVALKLVADRETEIKNYQPTWRFRLNASTIDDQGQKAKLVHVDVKGQPLAFESPKIIFPIEPLINSANTKSKLKTIHPPQPYNTGDLLSALNSRFGYGAKQAQNILQRLFENGLITYPRTTSNALAASFLDQLNDFVANNYGLENVRQNWDHLEILQDGIQTENQATPQDKKPDATNEDAHECIRTTNLNFLPKAENIAFGDLSPAEQAVYQMIYDRTLMQGFPDAKYYQIKHQFQSANGQFLEATSKQFQDAGFKRIFGFDEDELNTTYYFTLNKAYDLALEVERFDATSCPRPFTEGSLIKKLQAEAIGRPSTFATYPSTILDRNYVTLVGQGKNKQLQTTPLGQANLSALLQMDLVRQFVAADYTKKLEANLDQIAKGKLNGQTFLKTFLEQFKQLQSQIDTLTKPTYPLSNVWCPECQHNRFLKPTKTGKQMLVCANFSFDPKTKIQSGCPSVLLKNETNFGPKR